MIKRLRKILIILGLFGFALSGQAQTEEATPKEQVKILGANTIERDPLISDASRLLGNVKLGFGDGTICISMARLKNVDIWGY